MAKSKMITTIKEFPYWWLSLVLSLTFAIASRGEPVIDHIWTAAVLIIVSNYRSKK